jgi:hypothetical protein
VQPLRNCVSRVAVVISFFHRPQGV